MFRNVTTENSNIEAMPRLPPLTPRSAAAIAGASALLALVQPRLTTRQRRTVTRGRISNGITQPTGLSTGL